MKTKFIFSASILIVCSFLIFISCKKQTTDNVKLNGIYIVPLSGSSATETKILVYSTTPYKYVLGTAISSALATSTNVTLAVDNDLVAKYNEAQKTTYEIMPAGSYSLEATSLTIPKDSIASNSTNLVIKADLLKTDVSYLLPVKVETVSSNDVNLNSAIATKYYIVRTPTPVIVNLSDGKPSSLSKGFQENASKGNDGNTSGEWGDGSVCETGAGNEEFWQVDLEAVSPRIDNIKIWNRTDCCDDRTINFYVFVSDVPFTGTSVASSLAQPGVASFYTDGKAGTPTEILPNVSGRYIRLQNTGTTSLTLAELTAIGIKP